MLGKSPRVIHIKGLRQIWLWSVQTGSQSHMGWGPASCSPSAPTHCRESGLKPVRGIKGRKSHCSPHHPGGGEEVPPGRLPPSAPWSWSIGTDGAGPPEVSQADWLHQRWCLASPVWQDRERQAPGPQALSQARARTHAWEP